MNRLKRWAIGVGAWLILTAPWLERVLDRLGHLLDLGCLGLH